MLSRNIEKKIINFLNKKGNKFKAEKLFKKSLKILVKKDKKKLNQFIYFCINQTLITFRLDKIKKFQNKTKTVKTKPIFILSSKNKLFYTLKSFFNFVKKKEGKSLFYVLKDKVFDILKIDLSSSKFINQKINQQKELLQNQNSLIFYRW